MSENEFTIANHNNGIPGQTILDAGLNVFAIQLLVESFTDLAGKDTRPVEFTFRGVRIKLQIVMESPEDLPCSPQETPR